MTITVEVVGTNIAGFDSAVSAPVSITNPVPLPENWVNGGAPLGANTLYALAPGPNGLIAGGVSALGRSTDGINYTPITIPGGWTLVLGGGYFNRFTQYFIWSNDGRVGTSSDGVNFSQISKPFSFQINGIADSGTVLVAASQIGNVAYSTNGGSTWTAATSGLGSNLTGGVAYGGGTFVIAGDSGVNARSTDGITWATGSSFGFNSRRIIYDGSRFVVVGGGLATSATGASWSSLTSPLSGVLTDITYSSGIYVVTNTAGNVAYSTDLISWTTDTLPAVGFGPSVVRLFADKWVIGGSDGVVIYST